MKIINTHFNQPYQLSPGTQLDVERPNLFFNEWGEQTFPVDLPDTPINRKMVGYADMLGNVSKPSTDINCTIQDGSYFMSCRQAIFSAQRKKGFSTSFYINEGSFLSRLSETALADVFGDETIPGVATVQQGIDFCRSLLDNTNPNFSVFPVWLDLDGERRMVNKVDRYNANGNYSSSGTINFYNAFPRSETINDSVISLSPGYYITPFLRSSYLLRRIFSYFGYQLLTNFFDTVQPFKDMVLINNTIDSLVNGTILLAHLIPNCMCSTLLNVYRKKFCCEFIPDEANRTVTIEFLRDIVKESPSVDLTGVLTSEPVIEFSGYKQIKIASENNVSLYDLFDSTAEISSKYPEASLDQKYGWYTRIGYGEFSEVTQIVADSIQPYYIGGNLPVFEVKVPDCAYSMIAATYRSSSSSQLPPLGEKLPWPVPYIGEGRTLNSTIVISSSDSDTSEDDEKTTTAEDKEQPPMLAFTYFDTITHGTNHTADGRWEYSLLYNGEHGIYERFYRDMDNLLRNSLHPVKADLLLSSAQKMNIKSHSKVYLCGQELLINKLVYSIGGKDEPKESEFFTTLLHTPVKVAPPESQRFLPNQKYKWKVQRTSYSITQDEFNASPSQIEGLRSSIDPLPAIYPLPPTQSQYNSGGSYFHRSYARHSIGRDGRDYWEKVEWSLTPILFSEE